ncbi:MAG TPA: M28 family metallopeptidase [Candidatus Sulfotelmatobacter sp.]|nr:M28 family metallopeptidase [Candidatus Sulfotelmatobacter sp.]
MKFIGRWIGAAFFCGAALLPQAISGGAQEAAPIRGFFPARVAEERGLEQRFRAIPEAARAEKSLRRLTSEPHMAGTEASRRVAEWLREQYASFGFDAQIVSYSAWMPQPREVRLELVAPEHKALATQEEPIASDKDTLTNGAVVGFNAYSPSADVTAAVVYVNYGMVEDYRQLEAMGVSVEGKIAMARYGRCYRGIKTKLAEEHKAAGLIIYSDPQDDGYAAGDVYPDGPWRPMSAIQRGSVEYTEIYPGDPLTPGVAATPEAKRLAPADAADVAHIPTMPINAQDADAILRGLGGPHVPKGWQGALPFTYHVGGGAAKAHMKLEMDYEQREIYDVIARLAGADDDEWVVMGNHHDAWVYGAADPNSGTAVMLETAQALGELARGGWRPRRTIVMCHWDGEEFGLIGSTEWVEANRAELQAKAVAYINTDVGVNGPNFNAGATPSLKELVREAAREVQDPRGGRSVYDAWRERASRAKEEPSGTARADARVETSGEVALAALGAGSDFCPFLDHAGIASLDMGFGGDYGVYHSMYDDFNWMKKFGDPTFEYHAALARVIGTIALRLDEADVLPFDYAAYAAEIAAAAQSLAERAAQKGGEAASLEPVTKAAAQLSAAAWRARDALAARGSLDALAPEKQKRINRALASVEQALLAPEGLAGRPWFKHTIYAPGSYAGYAAVVMPGVAEALDRRDSATLARESAALAAALSRAAARVDEIAQMARQ